MARIHKHKGARAALRERIAQGLEKPPLPASITALHEGSHAVLDVLLDLPGFISVDIKRRTHKTDPDTVPKGFESFGFTKIITPEVIAPDYAYKRVFSMWAPEALALILGYYDGGHQSDRYDIGQMAGRLRLGSDGNAVPQEWVDKMLQLTKKILSDPSVLAGVMNVAQALDRERALTADQVREIVAMHPVRPLPDEVQERISAPVMM